MSDKVLNLGVDARAEPAFVQKATDPLIFPTPYATPGDFTAQYPQPLDTTEIMAMCEEITMLKTLPEQRTALNAETWRELNVLAFNSGSSYVSFADGACPEEYYHEGDNSSVNIKNIGAKKTLSVREIMHSQAVASANWNGINTLVGAAPTGEGMPGASDLGTFQREVIRNLKEKEVRLGMTLVMNGWDRLLIQGNTANNSLEFTGIETWAANMSCNFHTGSAQTGGVTGSYSSANFDRFLSESCAKPTHVFGPPQAIQEMLSGYFQLGFAGSQVINYADGNRITPGFNFAGFVNTGIGRLVVVADNNFRRTNTGGSTFQADLWTMRMTHNGEPLVYKLTQIPLSLQDLTPGCTTIAFQIWAATALVIKACCAHGKFTSIYNGRIVTTCTTIT